MIGIFLGFSRSLVVNKPSVRLERKATDSISILSFRALYMCNGFLLP